MSPINAVSWQWNSLAESAWPVALLLKLTCLLALAWGLHFALAPANLRWRVVMWRVMVIGLIGLVVTDASQWFTIPLTVESTAKTTSTLADPSPTIPLEPTPGATALDPERTSESARTPGSEPIPASDQTESTSTSTFSPAVALQSGTGSSAMPIQWPDLLFMIWLTGLCLLLIRHAIAWRLLAQVIRHSSDAPKWLEQLSYQVSRTMGTDPCHVRLSDSVQSPLLCRSRHGWTIVMPNSALKLSESKEVEMILTHEYAHRRSHDVEWNALLSVMTSLIWPHPLVWRICSAHVCACEFAADAESARRLGEPATYVRTLAKVALNVARPERVSGLAMARVSNVRARLERVQTTFGQLPLSRRRIAALAAVGLLTSFGLGAFHLVHADPPAAQVDQDETPDQRSLTIRVVDSAGQSIENPTVRIAINGDQVDPDRNDPDSFRVTVPEDTQYLSVAARAPGLVPMKAAWRGQELAESLPREFVFELPPGTRASGRILDETGKPIENAEVYLLVITDRSTRQQVDLYRHLVKTDAEGRWECDVMPAKFNDIWIRLVHPDFASDNMFGETAGRVSIDDIRSGKHTLVMKKGVTVTGTVVGPDAAPVAGATVFQGSDRFGSEYPTTTTDDKGEFQFPNSKPGEMVLTVYASGYAPELSTITVSDQLEPLDVRLQRGKPLKVRVLDPDGKPLKGVLVAADTWRNHRSLCDLEIPRQTDQDGRLVWNDAPADAIKFDILAQGFMDQRGVALAPQDDEHVIEFFRPLEVQGTVVDAATNLPVASFDVVPGIDWNRGGQVSWERRNKRPGAAGEFRMQFGFPRPGHLIQIEAEGYEPAQSRVLQSNEGKVELVFKLQPTKPLVGMVKTPTGKPAAKADVIVALPKQHVDIFNGRMRNARDSIFSITTAEGAFSVPSQKGEYKLLILHESGVAIIDGNAFVPEMTIQLERWSAINGTVRIGDQPAKQTSIQIHVINSTPFDQPRVSFSGRALSDDQGQFELVRVPPNQTFHVSRVVPRPGTGEAYTHAARVKTTPGQQHEVNIGGGGRPVVGNVQVPEGAPEYQWSSASIHPVVAPFEKPDDWDELSKEQQGRWYQDWLLTDEGAAYQAQVSRSYTVVVQEDGSFHVDDVPPGKYNLTASITASVATDEFGIGEQTGSLVHEFTVPDDVEKKGYAPVQLGTLSIALRKLLKVDDIAPDFSVAQMDGSTISLSDLRGTYVLVDFWATWCGPCLAEMPNLIEAHGRLANAGNFVTMSVSMDTKIDEPRAYLEQNPLPWLQGHITGEAQRKVQNEYGFLGIPATFLIGPDGRVIAKDIRGPELADRLEQLISK